MTIFEDPIFNRLHTLCSYGTKPKYCMLRDYYLAMLRVSWRLEDILKDAGFKPPVIGPDPIETDKELRSLLEGDPDGNPSRIFPTAGLTADRTRLKDGHASATRLRDTLSKVVVQLDADIKELKQKIG